MDTLLYTYHYVLDMFLANFVNIITVLITANMILGYIHRKRNVDVRILDTFKDSGGNKLKVIGVCDKHGSRVIYTKDGKVEFCTEEEFIKLGGE